MTAAQIVALTALGAVGALIVGICTYSKVEYGTFIPDIFIREKIIRPVIARKFLSTVEGETGTDNVSPDTAHNVWDKMEKEGSELTKAIMNTPGFKETLWDALSLPLPLLQEDDIENMVI